MRPANYLTLFLLFTIFSCTQPSNFNTEVNTSDSTTNSEAISKKDSKEIIKRKLKEGARLDKQEFGEAILYDDYYKGEITKFYIKDKDSDQRNITVVVYNDTIRYMKLLLQHVGNTSPENIKLHFHRIKGGLDELIKNKTFQIVDKIYLKGSENGETWISSWIITESVKNGRQDYWNFMVPESEFNYLKYTLKAFSELKEIKVKYLTTMK